MGDEMRKDEMRKIVPLLRNTGSRVRTSIVLPEINAPKSLGPFLRLVFELAAFRLHSSPPPLRRPSCPDRSSTARCMPAPASPPTAPGVRPGQGGPQSSIEALPGQTIPELQSPAWELAFPLPGAGRLPWASAETFVLPRDTRSGGTRRND
jgi:hypothetical protein